MHLLTDSHVNGIDFGTLRHEGAHPVGEPPHGHLLYVLGVSGGMNPSAVNVSSSARHSHMYGQHHAVEDAAALRLVVEGWIEGVSWGAMVRTMRLVCSG